MKEYIMNNKSQLTIRNFVSQYNLTTAAAIWFAASIGMAIGFNFYFMAIVAIAFAVLVPRIHHISKLRNIDR
jgi:uncharacterized membrane protein YhiD involved in acid resistance